MLLNIFFENMNGTLELFLIGVVFFAIYWFIMRKFNSLGLRMFIMFFSVFAAACVWIYQDEVQLKHTLANGEKYDAIILSKAKQNKNDNEVAVLFSNKAGKMITAYTSEYISVPEWDGFEKGKTLPVLYVPDTGKVFAEQSLQRFKSDKIYLYYFAGFFLLVGVIAYFWLRKLKVGVDENTGDEYVIKENGDIILDERKSGFYRASKNFNILSKMVQAFGK